MTKQVLDRLQMRHLKELGISANNASAYWHRVVRMNTNEVVTNWFVSFSEPSPCLATMKVESIKTYTLQDILDLLPYKIVTSYLNIGKKSFSGDILFYIEYSNFGGYAISCFRSDSLIDAAYEMLCWVLTNKYIQEYE